MFFLVCGAGDRSLPGRLFYVGAYEVALASLAPLLPYNPTTHCLTAI